MSTQISTTAILSQCLVCFGQFSLQNSLPCKCAICPECSLSYLTEKIKQVSFDIQQRIRCPNYVCGRTYSISLYQSSFSKQQQEQIQDSLFERYLKTTDDIKACPRSGCNYYGIVRNSPCSYAYECELCHFEWKDQDMYAKLQSQQGGIKGIYHSYKEICSDLYKYVFTQQCPKCGVSIYKNGGCVHMTCKKCNHEFCWLCLQNHKGHNYRTCDTHNLTLMFFYLSLIFNLLVLTGFHVILGRIFQFLSFLLMKTVFYDCFFVLLFLSYQTVIKKPIHSHSKHLPNKKLKVFLFVTALLSYVKLITYFSEDIFSFFYFIFVEIVIIATSYSGFSVSTYLYDVWLMHVQ